MGKQGKIKNGNNKAKHTKLLNQKKAKVRDAKAQNARFFGFQALLQVYTGYGVFSPRLLTILRQLEFVTTILL